MDNSTVYDDLIASTSSPEIFGAVNSIGSKATRLTQRSYERSNAKIVDRRIKRYQNLLKRRWTTRKQKFAENGLLSYLQMLSITIGIVSTAAVSLAQQLTPVVGGKCKLSAPDVHIGGKQAQFFLKCEPNADFLSSDEGVWVVKSRQLSGTPARISAASVTSATNEATLSSATESPAMLATSTSSRQPIHSHPKKASPTKIHAPDNYFLEITLAQKLGCVEDGTVRAGAPCAPRENCLHAQYGNPEEYLQCDPIEHHWTKRHCEKGYAFGFAQQSCSLTAKGAAFRQYPVGTGSLSCSYTQCSPMAPCSVGTCNNGYCCSPTPSFAPAAGRYAGHSPNTSVMIVSDDTIPAVAIKDFTTPMLFNDAAVAHARPRKRGLKEILRETTNKKGVCSSGFTSPVRCNAISERLSNGHTCPPGLFCDASANLCCPLLLALPSAGETTRQLPSGTGSTSHSNASRMRANNAGNIGFHVGNIRRPPDHAAVAMMMPARPNGGYQSGYRSMTSSQNGLTAGGGGGYTGRGNYGAVNEVGEMPYGNGDIDSMTVGGVRYYRRRGDAAVDLYQRRLPPAPVFNDGNENMNSGYGASLQETAGARIRRNCPSGGLSGGACVSGRCAPGYACSPTSNVCCAEMAQAIPATVCPDGTQAAGACVNNQCGAGFICNQGLCCASSSQTPRCLDGSQAIGACIQGNCGTGYSCTTGNICCPSTLNTCPNGQVSLGFCVNGQCPIGYTCINNQCCGASNSSGITCPVEDSRGPCQQGNVCDEPGVECDVAQQHCCPRTMGDPVGPCIQGEGGTRLCPDGYACTGPGTGQCYRLETNTCPPEEQFGPCAPTDPQCPPGYKCIGDFCCSETGTFLYRRRAKRHVPVFMQWM